MKQSIFTLTENCPIADGLYRMKIAGDTSNITAPGQFVNIKIDGIYLRRPISVCDVSGGIVTLIYKTIGTGTLVMSHLCRGAVLDLLTGLGNGYTLDDSGEYPLLVGGGVGSAPLYMVAKELVSQNKRVTAILGFRRAGEVFLADELKALGCTVMIATEDGSLGHKGYTTDLLASAGKYTYFYACGPEPMLKALCHASVTDGQMSFEARMGCGFGVCMGCSCHTLVGDKRICKDGPVMKKSEVLW